MHMRDVNLEEASEYIVSAFSEMGMADTGYAKVVSLGTDVIEVIGHRGWTPTNEHMICRGKKVPVFTVEPE